VVDYLTALGEALRIPPYGTEAGEPIYYRLLADRLEVAVHTLEVTLGNGLDRALPDQTAALRARVAELSTDVYRHAGENWGFHPARPQVHDRRPAPVAGDRFPHGAAGHAGHPRSG
jgi:hypothetical protein